MTNTAVGNELLSDGDRTSERSPRQNPRLRATGRIICVLAMRCALIDFLDKVIYGYGDDQPCVSAPRGRQQVCRIRREHERCYDEFWRLLTCSN